MLYARARTLDITKCSTACVRVCCARMCVTKGNSIPLHVYGADERHASAQSMSANRRLAPGASNSRERSSVHRTLALFFLFRLRVMRQADSIQHPALPSMIPDPAMCVRAPCANVHMIPFKSLTNGAVVEFVPTAPVAQLRARARAYGRQMYIIFGAHRVCVCAHGKTLRT